MNIQSIILALVCGFLGFMACFYFYQPSCNSVELNGMSDEQLFQKYFK